MGRMEHNLACLGEESFERHGDYESLWFEGRWLRTGELFERGRRLAGGLRALGIAPGDRVAVMLPNCPEVGIAYAALWRAGAVVTPVIFLLPPAELRYVLGHSGARAVVTAPELLSSVLAAAEGLESLEWVISTGPQAGPETGSGTGGVLALASLEAAEPVGIVQRDDRDLAALLYTGGTTGRAKGVMLSHENLWLCGSASREASHVPGTARFIVPLPLSHAFGLIVTVVGLHSVEPYSSVLQRWFDPPAFLDLVQRHHVQSGAVVPSMLQMLLWLPLEDYDLSSLRHLTCGAAPLPPEVAQEIERRVPGLEVAGDHRRNAARRVAAHRRHRPPRRGRVPVDHRPQEGPDHPGRLQRLPARRRGGAGGAPGGGDGRGGRAARPAARRGGGRLRVAAPGAAGDRRGAGRLRPRPALRLQVPARGARPRRPAAHPGRQDRPQGPPRPAVALRTGRTTQDGQDRVSGLETFRVWLAWY